MFVYEQKTGHLYQEGGHLLGEGYSGFGEGKNNPDMQGLKNVGPIPVGFYTIGPAYHHPKLGPVTMDLLPDEGDEEFGRDAFRMHGDNLDHTASHGCIIQDHPVRVLVNLDGDRRLQVVREL